MIVYRIRRFFQDPDMRSVTIATGLTAEQAEAHCNDPETSSETCTEPGKVALTAQVGPWFDGYDRYEDKG